MGGEGKLVRNPGLSEAVCLHTLLSCKHKGAVVGGVALGPNEKAGQQPLVEDLRPAF